MDKTKIGRNDSCPCGSGKKHKKCCMLQTISAPQLMDFSWRKMRKLEGTVVDRHLSPYVQKHLKKEIIETAFLDLIPETFPDEVDEKLFLNKFFMPWFMFNWIPADNFGIDDFDADEPIAMNYLKRHKAKLSDEEKRFIETICQTHYSFYCILHVEKDQSLEVKDIFLQTTHRVKERQATHFLKRGDIVFGRILTLDDQSIFVGLAPYNVPSHYMHELIKLRKELIIENEGQALTSQQLRDNFDVELFDYYFEILSHLFGATLPQLCNTDGEPFQFCKSYFEINCSLEEALEKLLPLTMSENKNEFISEAKGDKKGDLSKIEFPWLRKGNNQHSDWDNTVMGHIVIKPGKLTLETNSENRAKLGSVAKIYSENNIFYFDFEIRPLNQINFQQILFV